MLMRKSELLEKLQDFKGMNPMFVFTKRTVHSDILRWVSTLRDGYGVDRAHCTKRIADIDFDFAQLCTEPPKDVSNTFELDERAVLMALEAFIKSRHHSVPRNIRLKLGACDIDLRQLRVVYESPPC